MTKSGHLSWSFLVSSLRITNFGHLSLLKNCGDQKFWSCGVGALTLTVPNFGNSAVFVEVVSGVMTQNSLRGVGVESKSSFCNKPMV